MVIPYKQCVISKSTVKDPIYTKRIFKILCYTRTLVGTVLKVTFGEVGTFTSQ